MPGWWRWARIVLVMAKRTMFRMVDLPDDVPGRLFLYRMPGSLEPLQRAIDEIRRRGISQVICLVPWHELEAKSPAYARLVTNGNAPWRQVMFPIVDFGVPSDRQRFLAFVVQMSQSLRAGDYILVHCAAGIGRTGLLASAVLVALGVPVDEAMQRVSAAGSYPERPEQVALVRWIGETVGARMPTPPFVPGRSCRQNNGGTRSQRSGQGLGGGEAREHRPFDPGPAEGIAGEDQRG